MVNKILEKIDEIDYNIRKFQSERDYMSEDEYYEFMDAERFKELFPEETGDLFDDTTFVIFENGEEAFIIKQYNMGAIDSYCEYLNEFKSDLLTVEDIDKIEQELLSLK